MRPAQAIRKMDVVGVGNNATDTILRVPRFPSPDSKIELLSAGVKAGGQVASAVVACRRWGLHACYVGKIGDDDAGRFQMEEMQREDIETHWITAPDCQSQKAFILVDETSGERTVLWKRDPGVALRPDELKREWISGARILHVGGHDTEAATRAAQWAREVHMLVVGDFDNLYPGVEALLECVDFPITSEDFPERLTRERDLLKSLPEIFQRFKPRLIAATLGPRGVLAWEGDRFMLCPGFIVKAVDTTGAGDIFHGAFVYGLAREWPVQEILEFSCAAAALNCRAEGARGGIAPLAEIAEFRRAGARSQAAYSPEELRDAARAAKPIGATRKP